MSITNEHGVVNTYRYDQPFPGPSTAQPGKFYSTKNNDKTMSIFFGSNIDLPSKRSHHLKMKKVLLGRGIAVIEKKYIHAYTSRKGTVSGTTST